MSDAHLARGRWGESHAVRWYAAHGYELVERNWRCPLGEIDLVLRKRELLVIAEVKTRRDDRFGSPTLAVDARKQIRLRRLAIAWMDTRDWPRGEVRFDVVAITGTMVEVIEAAF
jgi:putative endonuclease